MDVRTKSAETVHYPHLFPFKKLFEILIFILYVRVFAGWKYEQICVQGQWRPEESGGSPRIGVAGGCDLSCGCYELNQGPLEKQPIVLTSKLSLQFHIYLKLCKGFLKTLWLLPLAPSCPPRGSAH